MSRRHRNGLTLIELLISVMLISVMLGAIWMIYGTGTKVFYSQASRYDIKEQINSAFTTMARELRQALSITAATATSVTFTADLDSDGANETIQYAWAGTAGAPLNRVEGASTKTLVRSINSLAFSYYAENSNITPLSFPVTVGQIKLVAFDATAVKGSETFRLRTKVYLRNI